jgi:predicted transcriptional regulator
LANLNEYVAILGTVAYHNPSNLAQLAALIRIDYDKLADALDFLHGQGCLLLATSEVKTGSQYSITERGLRILEFFNNRP